MSVAVSQITPSDKSIFGFWVYLMTDCVLFASLFATYAVLQAGTFGGPGPRDLFNLQFVMIETLVLLTSSFTSGLMLLAAHAGKKSLVLFWLFVTFALGATFLSMELYEFSHLIHEGYGWQRSGFLTAFFTLVGTHGLHILIGLLWALLLGVQVLKKSLSHVTIKRLTLFSLFWHFLDVVWIFIFSIVYLLGVL